MKKLFITILFITIVWLIIDNQETITDYILKNHIFKREIVYKDANEYKLSYNFQYLEENNKFIIKEKKDITNIIYTILNNGWEDFVFYCDFDYKDCISDVETLIYDQTALSIINNFVHPYNSYNRININYNNFGQIEIFIDKLYTKDEIDILDKKVDEIIKNILNENMSDREKIKTIHDYIINTTNYDNERAYAITNNLPYEIKHQSNKAFGPLIEGMGICGGYSDAMSLFLDRLNIKNYKISNNNHIWNFVYIDNNWYHLDLTWDDPTVDNNEDILLHTYFLIKTKELENLKDNQHNYNKNIFIEAN